MSSGPYIYEKLAQLLDQDRNVSHAQGLYWLLGTSVAPPGGLLPSREVKRGQQRPSPPVCAAGDSRSKHA